MGRALAKLPSNVVSIRRTPAAKLAAMSGSKRTRMEVILITPGIIAKWKIPDFQRELRVTSKVLEVAEEIKREEGIVPGTIILGEYQGEIWIVDGQHRIEAFKLSKLTEGLINARIVTFSSEEDMADEFAKANDSIRRMAPDDRLRALEKTQPALFFLRQRCPFIGYGIARRGSETSPILSMSLVLRMWGHSANETPGGSSGAIRGATDMGRAISMEEAERCVQFLTAVYKAWGREQRYTALWNGLNLTLCAWLWRRCVTGTATKKTTGITPTQFSRCAAALLENEDYLDYLRGRKLGDRDRSSTYLRVRQTFTAWLKEDGMGKVILPAPAWFSNSGRAVV